MQIKNCDKADSQDDINYIRGKKLESFNTRFGGVKK
jgi:hypothetical protein